MSDLPPRVEGDVRAAGDLNGNDSGKLQRGGIC
jgi:hypothetical protein